MNEKLLNREKKKTMKTTEAARNSSAQKEVTWKGVSQKLSQSEFQNRGLKMENMNQIFS